MGSDAGDDTDDAGDDAHVDGSGAPESHEDTGGSEGASTSFVWGDVPDRTESHRSDAADRPKHDGTETPVANAGADVGVGSGALSENDAADGSVSAAGGEPRPGSAPGRTLDPERYLLAGETLDEQVDVRRGWVVATSHRLVVFDPDADGKRFVAVDRPNVLDVRTTGGGNSRLRSSAFRAGLYAVVLLAGGSVARGLGLRDLFTAGPDVGSTPGVGGLVSVLSLVGALVGLVVDVVLFGGLLAGVVALALYALYRRGRAPTLVVERAGEDDLELELPSNAVGRQAVARLEAAFSDELALARS
jgi:hypothetical protein